MKMLQTFLLMIWSVSLSLQAGPKGYFRTEKGALIRGEVLYADDVFYYYQRISNPEEILTIKIENVPASFRRIVDALLLKGEISTPPESIAVVQNEAVEKPYGEWQLNDNFERGNLSWHIVTLNTEDDQGRTVYLVTRYCEAKDHDYRKFDVLLIFSDTVTMIHKWQVTYQFDNNEPVTELWKGSVSDTESPPGSLSYYLEPLVTISFRNDIESPSDIESISLRDIESTSPRYIASLCPLVKPLPYSRSSPPDTALFAPTPVSSWFRGKLIESDHINFSINDNEGETRRFRFDTSHFDRVYEDVFKPLIEE